VRARESRSLLIRVAAAFSCAPFVQAFVYRVWSHQSAQFPGLHGTEIVRILIAGDSSAAHGQPLHPSDGPGGNEMKCPSCGDAERQQHIGDAMRDNRFGPLPAREILYRCAACGLLYTVPEKNEDTPTGRADNHDGSP
jgi:hypothetical protein